MKMKISVTSLLLAADLELNWNGEGNDFGTEEKELLGLDNDLDKSEASQVDQVDQVSLQEMFEISSNKEWAQFRVPLLPPKSLIIL